MSLLNAFFFERFNENHDPSNGQFTDGGGSGGSGGSSPSNTVGEKNGSGKTGKSGSGKSGPAVSGGADKGANGGVSRPYSGSGPRTFAGVGRLKGATVSRVFTPGVDHTKSLAEHDVTPVTFNELKPGAGSAEVFHKLIAEAKGANKFGAAVTLYSPEDYEKARLFTSDDGKVGFALKGDDIVSVFKAPDAPRGACASILPLAIQEGGRRLDCFDTELPMLYAKQGFKAVARTPFDENYQPDGWNKETFSAFNGGKPDVVFMVYDKNATKKYQPGEGKSFPSYDDAMAAQQKSVRATEPIASDLFDKFHDSSATAADIVGSVSGAREAISDAERKLSEGHETNAPVEKGGFIQKDGTYTPERQALHEQILNELFNAAAVKAATPAAGEKPLLTLLAGRGGSGKSWFTKSGVADAAHAIYINADDLQAKLPGYEGWNAAFYHEEASDITKQADDIARELGVSVIHDATMRTPGGSAKRTADYKALGYAVHGHYMFLPPQTSTKRALQRFVGGGTEGRFVPPEYLLGSTSNERSFDSLKGEFDKWSIYENTGASPKLVAASDQENEHERNSTRQIRARSGFAGGRGHPLFARLFGEEKGDGRPPEENSKEGLAALSSAVFASRYNENHDPSNGQFAESGGGGGGSSSSSSGGSDKGKGTGKGGSGKGNTRPGASAAKPAKSAPAAEKSTAESNDKRKAKLGDFEKAKINVDPNVVQSKERVDKFIDEWDQRVGLDPDTFKKTFTGGTDTTMNVRVGSNAWEIHGSVLDKHGHTIGSYQRVIDWRSKKAESAFFSLERGVRDQGLGKQLLAGNVDAYQKMGLEGVKVHANIDVGGYAWAKYGYVPTRESWRQLSAELRVKLGARGGSSSSGGSTSDTYTPESWEELSDDEQEVVKAQWMRDTRSDFVDSEIQSWRDNGGALDEAKYQVAYQFNEGREADWARDEFKDFIAERANNGAPVPYTVDQLHDALSVDYENDGEGRGDPKIEFKDDKLQQPTNSNPDQMELPGLEKGDPSKNLTDDMREELTERLTKAFNDKADKDADDIEPPEHLAESADDYQSEHWDHNMSDRERFRWARDNTDLPEREIENEDDEENDPDEVEKDDDSEDTLMKLASSNNPKALWAIADSPRGKELLLGSDWYGEINFKDKETMDRFNAYVGKKKAA